MTVAVTIGGVRFEGELKDFDAFAADSPELFKKVKEIEQAALVVGVLTKAPANTGNPSNQASEGPPPKCTHGVMKDLKEKNYKHRFYCASTDRSNQCQAKD